MTNEIKAIETRYKGCRFRSRLEARWAVAEDAIEKSLENKAYIAARSARFEFGEEG